MMIVKALIHLIYFTNDLSVHLLFSYFRFRIRTFLGSCIPDDVHQFHLEYTVVLFLPLNNLILSSVKGPNLPVVLGWVWPVTVGTLCGTRATNHSNNQSRWREPSR